MFCLGGLRRRRRKKSIGPCAKSCKGKKAGKFRKCVRRCMRGR